MTWLHKFLGLFFIPADGRAKSAQQLISTVLPFYPLYFRWDELTLLKNLVPIEILLVPLHHYFFIPLFVGLFKRTKNLYIHRILHTTPQVEQLFYTYVPSLFASICDPPPGWWHHIWMVPIAEDCTANAFILYSGSKLTITFNIMYK